jgi:hypothetical protein
VNIISLGLRVPPTLVTTFEFEHHKPETLEPSDILTRAVDERTLHKDTPVDAHENINKVNFPPSLLTGGKFEGQIWRLTEELPTETAYDDVLAFCHEDGWQPAGVRVGLSICLRRYLKKNRIARSYSTSSP